MAADELEVARRYPDLMEVFGPDTAERWTFAELSSSPPEERYPKYTSEADARLGSGTAEPYAGGRVPK